MLCTYKEFKDTSWNNSHSTEDNIKYPKCSTIYLRIAFNLYFLCLDLAFISKKNVQEILKCNFIKFKKFSTDRK